MKRKKGYFSISAVAKMFSVHQQTIRLYEKEGFITPKRSTGNTRLFSEEDVDRLEEIIYLTHQLGINLAGVEMILRLQKQIKKLQKEINSAFAATQAELAKESNTYAILGQRHAQQLQTLQQEKKSSKKVREKMALEPAKPSLPTKSEKEQQLPIELSEWHLDYEE